MKKSLWYSLLISLSLFFIQSSCLYGQETKRLTVAAVGDIMCHDSQLAAAWNTKSSRYDFTAMFSGVKPLLQRADLNIGNLETTLPGKDYKGYPYFGSPDELAYAIREAGFHVLSTANNHSMDRGAEGLKRTLDVLDKYQLLYTGTYRSAQERSKRPFVVIEKNELKIAILNYTYGTNGIAIPKEVAVNLLKEDLIREDLAQARAAGVDFILVSYHFGNEYERLPSAEQKKFVQLAFFEGADVVIGSHPHVVQPYELKRIPDRYGITRDRLVMYSLGNFISGQTKPYTMGGIILYFTLEKKEQQHRITNVRHHQVYTVRPNKNFSLQPLPELFESYLFRKLTREKQNEIKNYYEDVEKHLEPSAQGVTNFRNDAAPKE